ncbi:hypothetical protein GOB90_07850 [Acetobacter oeni]|nr:hypothetical protein [Acetobacter oeni]
MSVVSSASAHRLDDYLQATTIDLARNRIALTLRLTPGVAVTEAVLRQMDRDGDGVLSPEEKHAYAERIAEDLSFSLNGKSVSLEPGTVVFPSVAAMRAGTGTMTIRFDASGELAAGDYQVAYRNRGSGAGTVYLVNCLVPRTASIHVTNQKRSPDQSFYALDFSVDGKKG